MLERVVAGFHACHTQHDTDTRPGCDENKIPVVVGRGLAPAVKHSLIRTHVSAVLICLSPSLDAASAVSPAPDGGRPLCPLRGHFPAPRGITLVRGGKGSLLIYNICTAGNSLVNLLPSGGHGVPPLRLYGFIFITAGTCVLAELRTGGHGVV